MTRTVTNLPKSIMSNQDGLSFESTVSGVLFDWNGVLIDDEPLHYEAFHRVLEELGLELTLEAYQQHCQGRRDADGFVSLAQTYEWQLPLSYCVTAKHRYYKNILSTSNVFLAPSTERLLAWLHERVAIAVVTSSSRSDVENILNRSDQAQAFDLLVTAEDVTRGKPDPEGYLTAARMLDICCEKCLIVEDSPENLRGLIDYGFQMIGLGDRQEKYPRGVHVASSLKNVLTLLTETSKNTL